MRVFRKPIFRLHLFYHLPCLIRSACQAADPVSVLGGETGSTAGREWGAYLPFTRCEYHFPR